jgi:CubicO group peptidase (beta-lactamase class C family)
VGWNLRSEPLSNRKMRSFALLLLSSTICACGALHSRAPRAGASSGASAPSAELAAAIARVEHGLIPEVRIDGEQGGWTIEERLRAYHTPAVSIAVIHDYRLAWAKAYGVKDMRTGERADTGTLFQAASISKMVTAMAALQEVDAGKVSLDADINQALGSWKLPGNDFTRAHPVTLKQLLAHTAGTNVRAVIGHPPDAPLPTLHQILDGEPPANTAPVRVEHPPGKEFRYSGGGSLIVQQLVVDLAGRPFPAAMKELVFAPLGLAHSTFEVPMPAELFALTARAHDYDETVLPEIVYPEAAPAGLWTTPSDLARFASEIQLGLQGRSKLVSMALAQRMTTPVAPIGVPDVSTGMGTFIERHGDTVYFGHDGLNDGFLSVLRVTTTGGEGAVVMSNGAGSAKLIFEILRSIAVEYKWSGWLKPPIKPARLDPARLRALAGRYSAGVDRSVLVLVSGDHLEAREPLREPLELIAISDHTFASRLDDTRFEFRRAASGRPELVRTPPDDEPMVMTRIPEETIEPLRLLEAGRHDEALALYRALRASHPADPALAESRFDELASDLLDHRFDLERAIRVFRMEAALYPESANANAGLALAYLRAGRRAEAAPFHAAALRLLGTGKKRSEIEEIYLGLRIGRLKRLAGGN